MVIIQVLSQEEQLQLQIKTKQDTDEIYKCNLNGCSETMQGIKFNCIEGYVGPLCDSCDINGEIWGKKYGRSDNDCIPCTQNKTQYVYMIFFFLLYIVYLANSLIKQMEQNINILKMDLLRKIDLFITSKSCSLENGIFQWINMFIHYFQLLSLFFVFSSANFPYSLQITVTIFGSPAKTAVTNFDCVTSMSNSYPLWFHRIVYVIGKFIIQYLVILLVLYLSWRRQKNQRVGRQIIKCVFEMSFIQTYLFYQPSMSQLLISPLFCRNIGGKSYLSSQLNFQCYSDIYYIFIISIIIPLIFIWCILIPFIIYKKLKFYKHQQSLRNSLRKILVYGILYNSYKKEYLYWEIVKMFKKLLLMIVMTMELSETKKIAIILAILQFYQIKIIQYQPFQNIRQFQFEKVLIMILVFTYIFLYFIIKDDITTETFLIIGYVLVILMNIYLLKFITQITFGSIVIIIDQNQSTLIKYLYHFSQKYPRFLFLFRFTHVKARRVHNLWKKVILSFRRKQFRNENKLPIYANKQPEINCQSIVPRLSLELQQLKSNEKYSELENQYTPKADTLTEYENLIIMPVISLQDEQQIKEIQENNKIM